MNERRPVRKISQIKCTTNLVSWVPVAVMAESRYWVAWPNGPTPQKRAVQQLFGSKSKNGGEEQFLQGGMFIW